jgi:hypothetical protein
MLYVRKYTLQVTNLSAPKTYYPVLKLTSILRPMLVFFLGPTKPSVSYGKKSSHRRSVLVKSKEITVWAQTHRGGSMEKR